jgi:hypothetical protein
VVNVCVLVAAAENRFACLPQFCSQSILINQKTGKRAKVAIRSNFKMCIFVLRFIGMCRWGCDIIYNVQQQMFARQKGQNHLEAD